MILKRKGIFVVKIIDFKDNINQKDLHLIKEVIKNNGIIVFPTETVYGIGASIYSLEGIKKIFASKGRPNDNPLIVHISSREMLNDISLDIDDVSALLMDTFWPGPLSIILPKKDTIADIITGGLDTVGVRMPANDIALKIISTCNTPLAAPSANASGRPSGTDISDIYEELKDKVDLIIDGGKTTIGLESTVVRVIRGVVHILRPGGVSKEEISSLGLKVVSEDNKVTKGSVVSPGVKYKHYAPNAKAILVYSKDKEKMINKINELTQENTVVICTKKNKDRYKTKTIAMGNDLNEIAKNIFKVLRSADKLTPNLIIIEGVESNYIGRAIMNRLIKAVSYNYLEL